MKETEVVRRLRPIRRRHPWLVPGMVTLGVLAALSEGVGLTLFLPLLYSIEGASFTPPNDSVLGSALQGLFSELPASRRLLAVSVLILGLVLVKNLLIYANAVLNGWIRTMLVHSLRSDLAARLLWVRVDYIEGSDAGRLVNALQVQTQETGTAFQAWIELLTRAGTALVFSAFLLLVSVKLTLVVGAALVVISLLVRLAWRRIENRSRDFVEAWDELSQRCLEILSGARTIRIFGRASDERRRFDEVSHRASQAWFQLDLLSGLIRPASEVMLVAVLVGVLVVTLRDASGLPVVLTFAFILYRLRPHIQGIDQARAKLLGAKAPVETVMDLLDHADKPDLDEGGRAFSGLGSEIRFDGVSFRHATADRDALCGASLVIPAGRTTAVLGRSGAGKSTLIDLVLRLYDPTEGTVVVDGVPLREFDVSSWRARIAFVAQDAVLFNATVSENVAYGRPDAGPEDVRRAVLLAGAEEFVLALPEGYDTVVGEQGVRISTGQKQRLALARALVREPDLIVLDEATNALDAETESLVMHAVRGLGGGVTAIVVSHRLSAVAEADHFVLLEDGCVRVEGGPEVIVELHDTLRSLYGTQGLGQFDSLAKGGAAQIGSEH